MNVVWILMRFVPVKRCKFYNSVRFYVGNDGPNIQFHFYQSPFK